MSTRIVVMEKHAGIDMLDVLSLGVVLWLLQSLVENRHSRKLIGEAIK